jgi:hypothetical protein
LKKLIYFFTFLIISIILFLFNLNLVFAASIGVSPAMLILENESINKSITIINTNNESLDFEVKCKNNMFEFIPNVGRLKKNSNLIVKVFLNPYLDLINGSYDDLIFVTVSKKGNLKNGVGIKASINLTKDISSVEYYFVNETSKENITKNINILENKDKLGNLITGMNVLYNGKIKGNAFVSVIFVGIIIWMLYLLVRENKIDKN